MSSDIVQLINRLSGTLRSGKARPAGVAEALRLDVIPDNSKLVLASPVNAEVEIVNVPATGCVWSVIVSFADPFPLSVLESAYGPSSPLPRSRPGDDLKVRLKAPDHGVTLLAHTRPDQLVNAVTVQADLVEI